MKLIPAIDLKGGKCVRLSGGKESTSVIYNDNPIEQAKIFEKEGCERIHIVDLDAAFGNRINNKSEILKIRNSISIEIELGGGIRTEEDASFWIDKNINFLILGSIVIKDPECLNKIIKKYPNKIYISLDDNNGKILTKGWVEESKIKTNDIIKKYNHSKIKGFVFTDVLRDGLLKGIDITKTKKCLEITKKPIIVGGGLSSEDEIKKLSNLRNVFLEGVIAGKSYYLGKINIKNIKRILS